MNRVSKINAEKIAQFLLKDKIAAFDKLTDEISVEAKRLVESRVPSEVTELNKKFPEYFNKSSSVSVSGYGFNHERFVLTTPSICKSGGSYQIAFGLQSDKEGKKLRSLVDKQTKLKNENSKLNLDLQTCIYSLKTYNKIVETFPTTKDLIESFSTPKTVPAINVDSLLKRLKQYE